MSSQFVLINSPIQLGQVKLGSLVPNVVRPHIDAFAPIVLEDDEVVISEQLNFQALVKQGKNSTFEACLTRLVSASLDGSSTRATELSSHKAMCYEIKNPLSFFKEVAAEQSTRLWLQGAIAEGRKTYIITGLRTLFDAQVEQNDDSSRSGGGRVRIPVGAILAGGVDPIGGLADVGIGGKAGRASQQQQKYLAPGEQIYAIQYRKVAFKWFSSKSVDAAFLDAKNRWKILGEEMRGPEDEDEDEEDVVETDFEDQAARCVKSDMSVAKDGQEEYLMIPEGSESESD